MTPTEIFWPTAGSAFTAVRPATARLRAQFGPNGHGLGWHGGRYRRPVGQGVGAGPGSAGRGRRGAVGLCRRCRVGGRFRSTVGCGRGGICGLLWRGGSVYRGGGDGRHGGFLLACFRGWSSRGLGTRRQAGQGQGQEPEGGDGGRPRSFTGRGRSLSRSRGLLSPASGLGGAGTAVSRQQCATFICASSSFLSAQSMA